MADRKSAQVDARTALEEFQDYLAPRLDVYEQAVYLYILRHSRLIGRPRVAVELKSARLKIARSLGKRGSPLAVQTCLEKLRSLAEKGCIRMSEARNATPDVRVLLPSEMPGLVKGRRQAGRRPAPDLESLDFFAVAEHRRLIIERDGGRCFYCRRKLNDASTVLDRVDRFPPGNNCYRNVVASCRRCANRKGESSAEDLLRVLFREGFVRADLLSERLEALELLREGRLRPDAGTD